MPQNARSPSHAKFRARPAAGSASSVRVELLILLTPRTLVIVHCDGPVKAAVPPPQARQEAAANSNRDPSFLHVAGELCRTGVEISLLNRLRWVPKKWFIRFAIKCPVPRGGYLLHHGTSGQITSVDKRVVERYGHELKFTPGLAEGTMRGRGVGDRDKKEGLGYLMLRDVAGLSRRRSLEDPTGSTYRLGDGRQRHSLRERMWQNKT